MFYNSASLHEIPFKLNFKANTTIVLSYMFQTCNNLREPPEISTVTPKEMSYLFNNCWYIRNADEFFSKFDYSYLKANSCKCNSMFFGCRSLRSVPYIIFENAYPGAAYNRTPIDGAFNSCYVLDEIVNLPLPYTATWTSNAFSNTFSNCYRLKNITFETNENGTPKAMNWKNQTIELSWVGYGGNPSDYTGRNSGITADKHVKDDATYQALKNDPDWFTTNIAYSRYNHDSAVNTINSLPDASSSGGTNTIRFKGDAGSATDGGAINTLTEAEIAVAAAKGWTVTFA
jgi:hypothetical protein